MPTGNPMRNFPLPLNEIILYIQHQHRMLESIIRINTFQRYEWANGIFKYLFNHRNVQKVNEQANTNVFHGILFTIHSNY